LLKTENNSYFPTVDSDTQNAVTIDVSHVLNSVPFDSVASKLTLAKYYSSKNIIDFKEIERDLKLLDSLYPNKTSDIRPLIYHILSDSLKSHVSNNIKELHFQELAKIQNLQISYHYYSRATNNIYNNGLYNSLNDFWGQFVADKLSAISKKELSSKTGFKYRYLEARSNQYRFYVNTKKYSVEKVITGFLDSDWGHLLNASWNQASLIQKFIIGFILLFSILAYINFIKEIKRYFKK
jgi:hypothetical protein